MSAVGHALTLASPGAAELLNLQCYCRTLDYERLRRELDRDAGSLGLTERLLETHPHLFSATMVYLSAAAAAAIERAVAALERVIALPAYRAQALERACSCAQRNWGTLGAYMGFDFHLGPDSPRLIEINTNAGGALLNAELARAQQSCCAAMDAYYRPDPAIAALGQTYIDMFRNEWRQQRGNAPLRTIAIVDDHPETQYLAPEFCLFVELCKRHGYHALIADAQALQWRDGQLWSGGAAIDLVYNRLTDFALEQPAHAAINAAYLAGAVVLTPNPYLHALYADKRNLVGLSDPAQLRAWGVAESDIAVLQAVVPEARLLGPDNADALWTQRRDWFFKPYAGYAGKAAYRGDKLTRGVWDEIRAGGFIAQALVPPSARLIDVDGTPTELKFDVRAYAYAGQVQLLAARIYRGQTTNFRTPGGGFAPITRVG